MLVRWSGERRGSRSEGNEIALYRFYDQLIAEAWFYPDGYEEEALTAVFGYA